MSAPYHLAPEEEIKEKVTRHWASLVLPGLAAVTALIALPFVPAALASFGGLANIPFSVLSSFALLLMLILALVALAVAGVAWSLYRKNYLIITNLNLIVVIQHGLFHRRVYQMSLANLEDVKAHRSGILPTVLDYGSVEIQSASEDDVRFIYCPDPSKVADDCLHAHEEFMKLHPDRG